MCSISNQSPPLSAFFHLSHSLFNWVNKDLRNLIERFKVKWEDKTFLNGHFLPQYFYLNPDIKTIHIIKYENLENDWKKISNKLKESDVLPRVPVDQTERQNLDQIQMYNLEVTELTWHEEICKSKR